MRVESRRLRSLNVVGPTETGKRENRYIATIRQLPKRSQELEAAIPGIEMSEITASNSFSAIMRTLSVPVTVPLEGTTLQGDDWSATLNSGWMVQPAARSGSFAVVRKN